MAQPSSTKVNSKVKHICAVVAMILIGLVTFVVTIGGMVRFFKSDPNKTTAPSSKDSKEITSADEKTPLITETTQGGSAEVAYL